MKPEIGTLVSEVETDQSAIGNTSKETRKRVLRMGRNLRRLQKLQKKEQAETEQSWKKWLAEQKEGRALFPEETQCRKYMLISRYPKAYKEGMSIKEAYKMAGKWKKNGGNEPVKEKVAVKATPIRTAAMAAGKLQGKIDKMEAGGLANQFRQEDFTDDSVAGCLDAFILCRGALNVMIKELRQWQEVNMS